MSQESKQTVFCQIMKRKVTVEICTELQNTHQPKDCFGCAAHSRVCAKCRTESPICPELDVCRTCLFPAIAAESVLDKGSCDQTPRCLTCKQQPVYYAEYDLCLRCTAEKFAGITVAVPNQPLDQERRENTMPRNVDEEMLFTQAKALLERVGRDKITNLLLMSELHISYERAKNTHKRLHVAGLTDAPRTQNRGTSQPASRPEQRGHANQGEDDSLYRRARELVIREQKVSVIFLKDKLHIGYSKARTCLRRLRNDAVIQTTATRSTVIASVASARPVPAPSVQGAVLVPTSAALIKVQQSSVSPIPANGQPVCAVPVLSDVDRTWRLSLMMAVVGKDRLKGLITEAVADLEELNRMTQ